MKNAFYFILKPIFLIFWLYRKNGLIRTLWLISILMASQTGYQIITMHILSNISRSKGNQARKLGQLIEYTMRNLCFKNDVENMEERLVLDLALVCKRALYKAKASGQQPSLNISWQTSTWTHDKNKFIKFQTVVTELCSILIFYKRSQFLHYILCMVFQEKYFSCYILLTDKISLSDCLQFFRYWTIFIL